MAIDLGETPAIDPPAPGAVGRVEGERLPELIWEAVPPASTGSTNARVAIANNSSEPLPMIMFSGLHRCNFASFSRSGCAVGFG